MPFGVPRPVRRRAKNGSYAPHRASPSTVKDVVEVEPGFIVERGPRDVKPPSPKEIERMKLREKLKRRDVI